MYMEGERKQKETMFIDDGGEYKREDMVDIKEKKALRQMVDEEEHLKIYGWLRERIAMKTYLYGLMDYVKS